MHKAELIEIHALKALHQALPPKTKSNLNIISVEYDGVLLSIAPDLPSSAIIINRGLGFEGPQGQLMDSLHAALENYHQNRVNRFFLQLVDDPIAKDTLEHMGLRRARAWQKFELAKKDFKSPSPHLQVERITARNDRIASIICAGFDLGDISEPWLRDLPTAPNWHTFAALVDDKIAATGSVFIENKLAWLDFAATAPEFRRFGCQSALIAARLDYAFGLGCEMAFSCTGVADKDDPQHSYSNLIKAGFKETYIRENWEPLRL